MIVFVWAVCIVCVEDLPRMKAAHPTKANDVRTMSDNNFIFNL